MDGRTNKNPPHGFWSFFRVALTEIAPLALRYKKTILIYEIYEIVKKSEVLAESYRFRQNFRT